MSIENLQHKQWLRAGDQQWLENRLRIARAVLAMSDQKTASTFDAQIILCCALGAIAATIWPGHRIDKFRYNELLTQYCSQIPLPSQISIPSLVESFKGKPEEILIKKEFNFDSNKKTAAHEIDCDELTVLKKVPTLPLAKVREASYASIIYRDLRCGLVHTYALQERLIDWVPGGANELVYFSNNGSSVLFVPYEYIERVVKSTAEAVFDYWVSTSDFIRSLNPPAKWWIEG